MNIIYSARIYLIRIGKVLPFIVCLASSISYFESCLALCTENYILYDSYVILNKPISFFIGQYFEYNLQMLVILCVLSVAIETCIYNKLACLYLGVNLLEKSYFDFELDIWQIYIISILNLIISAYFTFKGVKILLTHK